MFASQVNNKNLVMVPQLVRQLVLQLVPLDTDQTLVLQPVDMVVNHRKVDTVDNLMMLQSSQ